MGDGVGMQDVCRQSQCCGEGRVLGGAVNKGDAGGANSVCRAGHGRTRVTRRVSRSSERFEES